MNHEGYRDPTAEKAIKRAGKMPKAVYAVYKALNDVASLHGFEIIGLRDRKTGKIWKVRAGTK